jgi:hypothetical protein
MSLYFVVITKPLQHTCFDIYVQFSGTFKCDKSSLTKKHLSVTRVA